MLLKNFMKLLIHDYYGKEAYQTAYRYLSQDHDQKKLPISMVGFVLKNTLSDHGAVTRGLCQVENHQLVDIVETHNIEKVNHQAVTEGKVLPLDTVVSMNMWGLYPEFFSILEARFETFLSSLKDNDLKSEYLLPTIIGDLLHEQKATVEVLTSHDQWFGVTYQEDKYMVKESIQKLIAEGKYPEKL